MDHKGYFSQVDEATSWLRGRLSTTPQIVVVLSAGLDAFADQLSDRVIIPGADVPHFPISRAEGHSGKLVFGTWKGIPLVALQGRQHYYEGYTPQEIVFPYFVLEALGAKNLITTNAVGGIRHDLDVGDIFLITDHISNVMGPNPLIGLAVQRKTDQFTSMIDAYSHKLRSIVKIVSNRIGIELKEGIFVGVSGPSYETPAEIKMLRTLGADTVGMSTTFEIIAANFLKMRAVSLAIITNPAADRHGGVMHHTEVIEAMKHAASKVTKLLQAVVEEMSS